MSKYRLERDIVKDTRQKYAFSEYMTALDDVFYSVYFRDVSLRNILWDSYRMNLWELAFYALDNHVDEIKHIQSIVNVLLNIPGCKLRSQKQR